MISFKFADGDWQLNGSGKLRRVSGPALLLQHIKKILETEKQNIINASSIPFRYNPQYGQNLSFIRNLVPIFTTEDARQAVQTDVRQTITKYAEIQAEKMKLDLDPSETLVDATVLALANKNESGNLAISYNLELVNANGETRQLEQQGINA